MLKDSFTMDNINLFQLKERMDEYVFNFIDSTQKWEKAYVSLDELVAISVDYFQRYLKENGQLPKGNTFWVLFMDVASKLIYFHTMALYHLKKNDSEETFQKKVIKLYTMAANCIPEINKEANKEFLKEISISYESIELFDGIQGEFEKVIKNKNNQIQDCLATFNEFSTFYLN